MIGDLRVMASGACWTSETEVRRRAEDFIQFRPITGHRLMAG